MQFLAGARVAGAPRAGREEFAGTGVVVSTSAPGVPAAALLVLEDLDPAGAAAGEDRVGVAGNPAAAAGEVGWGT